MATAPANCKDTANTRLTKLPQNDAMCFGKFVESVINLRDFNQVMVGVNPIKAWPKMYETLQKGKVFAGVVAKWDKGMVPEFQRSLFDVISLR